MKKKISERELNKLIKKYGLNELYETLKDRNIHTIRFNETINQIKLGSPDSRMTYAIDASGQKRKMKTKKEQNLINALDKFFDHKYIWRNGHQIYTSEYSPEEEFGYVKDLNYPLSVAFNHILKYTDFTAEDQIVDLKNDEEVDKILLLEAIATKYGEYYVHVRKDEVFDTITLSIEKETYKLADDRMKVTLNPIVKHIIDLLPVIPTKLNDIIDDLKER